MAGRQMEVIAVLWLVLELTGDPLLVGLAGGSALGLAFLSVFAGAVVDRLPRRLLMAAGQFIAAALAFVLMALLLTDGLKVWMIFVIIIGGGAFRTIELPVTNALLIDTVPRERLTNAVAMLGLGQNLTQFVGPIVGGFLYTPLTPAGLFGFIGVFYVIGGVMALMVRTRNTTIGNTTPRQIIIGVAAGLRHVWQRKELFMALLIAAMYNVTGFPVHHRAHAHLRPRHPHGRRRGVGAAQRRHGRGRRAGRAGSGRPGQRAATGLVAGLGGQRRLARLHDPVRRRRDDPAGTAALRRVLAIAMAIKVMTGIGRSVSLVLVMTLLMGNSDPEYRGRMGGMRVLAIQAHFPASALNGWMVTQIGAPLTALSLAFVAVMPALPPLTDGRESLDDLRHHHRRDGAGRVKSAPSSCRSPTRC